MSHSPAVLLDCLEATEQSAGDDDGWVTPSAVARQLSPTADAQHVGWELTRLEQHGLVEVWLEGGSSFYRRPR